MHTCYTVGYDSFVPGIIANLNPTRDAIIVGKGTTGRLVFLSTEDPPVVEDGKIMTVFRITERRDGIPTIALAGSPGVFDEPAVLVMVDTSRSVDHDDSTEGVATVAGSPHALAEDLSQIGNFLSVQGLYALLPGDAIRMRPLGVSNSDWAHQRVIFCEASDAGPVLQVLPRAQYHKIYGKVRKAEDESSFGARSAGTIVMSR